MSNDRRVFITGAGGFIGGWIAEALQLSGSRPVRAGVRSWSSAARLARFPMEIVQCDVMNPAQLSEAMVGVDTVVHCAFGGREVNVIGTKNVLRGALGRGVRRVVHLSTISVYGDVDGAVTEEHPLQFTGSEYGDSKIEAERLCEAYQARGLETVILRPTVVYGPYSSLWIGKFSERLMSGKWSLLGELGEGACNLVYVIDLVDAIVRAMDSGEAVGQAFNINGPEVTTWNQYFSVLNEALGLPPLRTRSRTLSRFRSVTIKPVKAAARYMLTHHQELITDLYRRSDMLRSTMMRAEKLMKSAPEMDELNMFGRKATFPIGKAERLLGYHPSYDFKTGLGLSVAWLNHETHLRARG